MRLGMDVAKIFSGFADGPRTATTGVLRIEALWHTTLSPNLRGKVMAYPLGTVIEVEA
jgi:hypothetical protein